MDLRKFFKVVHNDKHHLAFSIMRYLGRRISEVVKIKLEDLNLRNSEPTIKIVDCKSKKYRPLNRAIPPALLKETREYIVRHSKEISDSGGYLFFKPGRKRGHISPTSLRTRFREYCKRAEIDDYFAEVPAVGGQQSKSGTRRLHRLSSHSFRFRLGTITAEVTRDPWLTREVLGHRSLKSTEAYINYTPEKVNGAILEMAEYEEPRKPRTVTPIANSDYKEYLEFLEFKKMKAMLAQP